MIPKEDVIVLVSHDGYVKRTSKRSFKEEDKPTLKEGDYVIGLAAKSHPLLSTESACGIHSIGAMIG